VDRQIAKLQIRIDERHAMLNPIERGGEVDRERHRLAEALRVQQDGLQALRRRDATKRADHVGVGRMGLSLPVTGGLAAMLMHCHRDRRQRHGLIKGVRGGYSDLAQKRTPSEGKVRA